jgi:hypothetical protein
MHAQVHKEKQIKIHEEIEHNGDNVLDQEKLLGNLEFVHKNFLKEFRKLSLRRLVALL